MFYNIALATKVLNIFENKKKRKILSLGNKNYDQNKIIDIRRLKRKCFFFLFLKKNWSANMISLLFEIQIILRFIQN